MATETTETPDPAAATDRGPEADSNKMYCTSCGAQNLVSANFCQQCGHKMLKSMAPDLPEDAFAVMSTPEDRLRDLLVWAFHKEEAGDLDGALAICQDALKIEPESTSVHSLMGLLYEKKGQREKAVSEFEHVLELNPGSIADREKLEQLRDSSTMITPRKITTSRKMPRKRLFDGPIGAVVASVAVFLLVLMIGAWAVWAKNNQATLNRPEPVTNRPVPAPTLPSDTMQNTQAAPQNNAIQAPANSGLGQSGATSSSASANPNLQMNSQALNEQAPNQRPRLAAGTEVPPVKINVPQSAPLETTVRPMARPQDPGNTVHLPDNTQAGDTPNQSGANQNSGPAAARNIGKIEIMVSDSKKGTAGSNAATNAFSSMDSRSRRQAALQLQMQGNYRAAVKEYLRALDGAGDDAAIIHQQAGQCYQRLEERESAIAHYNDAIAEYNRQISLGKNVEAAKRSIRFCELGIKACQ